jgi:hypothetical protein
MTVIERSRHAGEAAVAYQWTIRILAILGVAAILAVTTLGNRGLEQSVSAESDSADQAFCQNLGFAPGAAAYVSCTTELRDLIRRHDRLTAASGLF